MKGAIMEKTAPDKMTISEKISAVFAALIIPLIGVAFLFTDPPTTEYLFKLLCRMEIDIILFYGAYVFVIVLIVAFIMWLCFYAVRYAKKTLPYLAVGLIVLVGAAIVWAVINEMSALMAFGSASLGFKTLVVAYGGALIVALFAQEK